MLLNLSKKKSIFDVTNRQTQLIKFTLCKDTVKIFRNLFKSTLYMGVYEIQVPII